MLNFNQFIRRVILLPIYSIFSGKIPFVLFIPWGGKWFMFTRFSVVQVKEPKLSSLDYYRHFIPSKGDLVLDIGGELGLEAVQFSKIVGKSGMVYTFECLPDHVTCLQSLTRTHSNIQVVNQACWNFKTTLDFFIGATTGSGSPVDNVKGQLNQTLKNQNTSSIQVNADTLDSFWEDVLHKSKVDFIKMDIEGAEYEALEGARNLLMDTSNIVVAAYHIRDGVPTAKRVAEYLTSLDFDVLIDDNLHVYGSR